MVVALEVSMILGGLAALLAYGLAAVVLKVDPRRSLNRILALVLFLEGNLQLIALDEPQMGLVGALARFVFVPSMGGLVLLYPLLLGHLDAPLTGFFRRPGVRRGLLVGCLGLEILLVPLTVAALRDPQRMEAFSFVPATLLVLLAIVYLVAIPLGISSWRRARTPSARQRAQAFLLSFGVRDACFALFIVVGITLGLTGLDQHPLFERVGPVFFLLPVFGGLLFVPLLTYGVLRTQVFDLDLHLQRGLSRTTVAAAFVAAYVLVSETLRQFSTPMAGAVLGAIAAGLLVFALAPLRSGADWVARKLVAGPTDPADAAKRLEVYEAALEEVAATSHQENIIDQPLLRRLRATLGLSERDHAVLEHALRGRARNSADTPQPWPTGAVVLGKYRILGSLGRGGSGHAYRAWDEDLRRTIVLKVLRQDQDTLQAALNEARAMARVRSPHVLVVHDVLRVGSDGYVVMEYAAGGSLKRRLSEGSLSDEEFWTIADGLMDALAAVHGAGLVHRDVKPSNVLLTEDGRVKLGDFGVAQGMLDATQSGGLQALGTPRYMSPEQARGARVDHRTDLYSAALTLYEAMTGAAYVGATATDSPVELQQAAADPVGDLSVIPDPLKPVFERAVARDPQSRFQSAAEMKAALSSVRGSVRAIRSAAVQAASEPAARSTFQS